MLADSRPQSPQKDYMIEEKITEHVDRITGGLIGKLAEHSNSTSFAIMAMLSVSVLVSFLRPDFLNVILK